MTETEAHWLLAECRAKIDGIDRRILELLNERATVVEDVGRAKEAANLPIFEPKREADVHKNLTENNHGPLPQSAVRSIFERIIDEMRNVQKMRLEQKERGQA